MRMPKVWTSAARGYTATFIPAEKNASLICPTNHCVSASVSNAIATIENLPRSPWIKSHWSWFNILGNNFASSSTRAKSAFAARSVASASFVFRTAPATFPKRNSPSTPTATAASARVFPIPVSMTDKETMSGAAAITASSAMPANTSQTHQFSSRSASSRSASRSVSGALLTFFARRSTAKGPRPEWGLAAGLLIGALFLLLNYMLK